MTGKNTIEITITSDTDATLGTAAGELIRAIVATGEETLAGLGDYAHQQIADLIAAFGALVDAYRPLTELQIPYVLADAASSIVRHAQSLPASDAAARRA